MEKLFIQKTTRSPEVNFAEGDLRLWGTFTQDDPISFYVPLHNWIRMYSMNPAPETTVHIAIHHTNGYWMPYIEKLLKAMILLQDDQHQVTINWYYSPYSIKQKAGQYLSKKYNHMFNFVEVEGIW